MAADSLKRFSKTVWILASTAPAALLIVMTSYLPILFAIGLSFFDRTAFARESEWAGLNNFAWLLQQSDFLHALGRSLLFTSTAVALQILVGIFFGLMLNEAFRGRGLARSLVLLPYLLPTVVVGLVFRWILNPQSGIVNQLLTQAGVVSEPINFFGGLTSAMPSVVVVTAWQYSSFAALLILARLQSISPRLYEAARTCGAGRLRCFIDVTLPNLRTTLLLLALLRGIWMFNKFDLVWIITAGGPLQATETLPIYMYKIAFQDYDFGRAAAVCSAMFVFLCIASIVYFWRLRPMEEVEVGR